jgi:hypothetical protein
MGLDQRDAGATYAKRLASLLIGALAIVLLAGSPSNAQTIPPKATTAKKECPFAPSNVPCHGTTIESVYTFSGYHEGDLKLIWVKLGPDQKSSMTASQESQCPECREADTRTFAWQSIPDVEITAHRRHCFCRVGVSRPPKAATTMEAATPLRAWPSTPPKATTTKAHCQYFSRGGPCAPIMSTYDFVGYREGDLSFIWAKLGPEHKETVGAKEVFKRTFTWHSVASVEITGVYEVREVGKGFRYKKLPTGKHGGHTILTDVFGDSEPNLVLQGRPK